jgi:carboxymethylenebutenolidase
MRNLCHLLLFFSMIGFSSVLLAQEKPLAKHGLFPPGEDNARAALDKSPRHGEWVNIYYDGKTFIRTWIVYPERKDRAPVVLMIHEIFGLSDWMRSVADQLAKEGFIVVVPDLISGFGPNGGGSESVSSRDSVVMLIRNLSAEETFTRLDYVRAFAVRLPSANGKCATVGFCWGGGRNFEYACIRPDLKAAIVYYGTSPDSATLAKLNVPVLGLYGGDDARVGVTVEPASVEVKKLGKTFEYEMYDGAGHGFLRAQSERDGANLRATEKAWPRMLAFLRKYF